MTAEMSDAEKFAPENVYNVNPQEIHEYLQTYGRDPYSLVRYDEFRRLKEDYEAEIGWLTHHVGYLTGLLLRFHPELADELKKRTDK